MALGIEAVARKKCSKIKHFCSNTSILMFQSETRSVILFLARDVFVLTVLKCCRIFLETEQLISNR